MDVHALILRANFNQDEIEDATCGRCGTFALALHTVLEEQGVDHQLILFVENLEEDPWCWRHVAIKVGDDILDIRGRVAVQDINAEFYTAGYHIADRKRVLKELREVELECRVWSGYDKTNPECFSAAKLREWRHRLRSQIGVDTSPVLATMVVRKELEYV